MQEPKERDQVLKEQKDDKKLLSRNKRMLGHLMGTLEKFRSEESKRKDVVNTKLFDFRIFRFSKN